MKPILPTLAILFLTTLTAASQTSEQAVIDELKAQLKTEKIDTSRIFLLGDLAYKLIRSGDSLEAKKLIAEGLALSEKQKFDYGFGHIYGAYGVYYENRGDYPNAEKYHQLSYEYFKKSDMPNAPLGAATALGNLGLVAERHGDLERAIQLRLECLKIWETSTVPQKALAIGNTYVGIASLYAKQGQYGKAIEYDKKGIEVRLKYNLRDSDLGTSYVFLANNFIRNKQLDSAQKYLKIGESLAAELKNPLFDLRKDESWLRLYLEQKNYSKLLDMAPKLKQRAADAKKAVIEYNAAMLWGEALQQTHQTSKAIEIFEEALSIVTRIGVPSSRVKALQKLSETYHQQGNDKAAYECLIRFNALNDSLKNEEMTLKLNDIDTKYQTTQKENQILRLEKDKQSQNVLIYGLLAGLLALGATGVLSYQNISKKRQIAQQQVALREKEIRQLQQEQQLTATNAIMKGQEEERTRVARDLHDGLGGLLTSIKLTLNNVKGNFILPNEGMAVFQRALHQLDTAINEMRRVAHSMMPEALVHYGLPDALKDYCEDLTESGNVKVHFQTLGMEQRLESSTEIIIYRIVQELLNNALKHAQATDVFVQLIRNNNLLNITVEDNGKGFDPNNTAHTHGTGMQNINTRVAYLNGKIEIDSKPNEGTSVFVEIPLS